MHTMFSCIQCLIIIIIIITFCFSVSESSHPAYIKFLMTGLEKATAAMQSSEKSEVSSDGAPNEVNS